MPAAATTPKEVSPHAHSSRETLLRVGLEMAQAGGFRSISVRGLCQRAQANTGTFVYHFGTRQAFVTELIETWYGPLFARLMLQYDRQAEPRVRLQAMLGQLLAFLITNASFVAQLLQDAIAGEEAVRQFISELSPRHPRLLLQCIKEAQQAGEFCAAPPLHVMMFIMSSLGLPVILRAMTTGHALLPEVIQQSLEEFAADPVHLEQRLQWAFKGLAPDE